MPKSMARVAAALVSLAGACAFGHGGNSASAPDPIVGKWRWGTHLIEVKPDRTAVQESGVTGAWKFLNSDDAERKYRFVWNGGKSAEDVSLSADGNMCDVRNNLDEVTEATRIQEPSKPAAALRPGVGVIPAGPQRERILAYIRDLDSLIMTLTQIHNAEFLKSVKAERDAYASGGKTDGYPPGALVPGNARILRNVFEADLKTLAKGGALATPKVAAGGAAKVDPFGRTQPKDNPIASAAAGSQEEFRRALMRGEFSWEHQPPAAIDPPKPLTFAPDGALRASSRFSSGWDAKWEITGAREVTLSLPDDRRCILHFDQKVTRFEAMDFDKTTAIKGVFQTTLDPGNPRSTVNDVLKELASDYESKLEDTLQPIKEPYQRSLEAAERDASQRSDDALATAVRAERDAQDFCDPPIPDEGGSAQFAAFRRLRADYQKRRDDAARPVNLWLRSELDRLERAFAQKNDPDAAAIVRAEREAVLQPPLFIVRATYGAQQTVDITQPLRRAIRFNRLEACICNDLAGDPQRDRQKYAFVTYKVGNGPEKTVAAFENEVIRLPSPVPSPKAGAISPFGTVGSGVTAPGNSPAERLLAGSVWTWFEDLTFSDPRQIVKFCKDGTGRTSWGLRFTWKVDGNWLTFGDGGEHTWVFQLDLAKKQGVDIPDRSYSREQRSMRLERRID